MWEWLSDAGLATPALRELDLDGGHDMLTPYRELTIVHAVRQPLTPPTVDLLTPARRPGTSYTYLYGVGARRPAVHAARRRAVGVHRPLRRRDRARPASCRSHHRARVAELPLESDASDVITIDSIRHDFGDTKHHSVSYSLLATTRFPSTSRTPRT